MDNRNTAISVQNVSKQYRLGEVGTGTISHDLNRWWHRVRGKEDPFLKIGETNDRSTKSANPYVWALKDINFEVQKGEVLGIIGKNGAGKSTLLKLLSRITSPSTGTIKARGRIASLLEVGTGFHPEMTGRENIYMNGTIMGMSRHEVRAKLDEIAAFAGVDRYLDTPVKRYSSGMTVRLGFAIAAYLDPEILIVDEVLAVGDAEFQKKAIGKMQDVSKDEGRTVLFVSHNMASIRMLCTNCVMLNQGKIIFNGFTNNVINQYLRSNYKESREFDVDLVKHNNRVTKSEFLTKFAIKFEDEVLYSNSKVNFVLGYNFHTKVHTAQFCILLYNREDILIFTFISDYQQNDIPQNLSGQGEVICKLEGLNVLPGEYYITVKLWTPGEKLDEIERVVSFTVEPSEIKNIKGLNYNSSLGVIYLESSWNINQ